METVAKPRLDSSRPIPEAVPCPDVPMKPLLGHRPASPLVPGMQTTPASDPAPAPAGMRRIPGTVSPRELTKLRGVLRSPSSVRMVSPIENGISFGGMASIPISSITLERTASPRMGCGNAGRTSAGTTAESGSFFGRRTGIHEAENEGAASNVRATPRRMRDEPGSLSRMAMRKPRRDRVWSVDANRASLASPRRANNLPVGDS